MATWSNSEHSSLDEEPQEVANLYLMAYEKDVTFEFKSDFTFDEFQNIFLDLLDKLKKTSLKFKELKGCNQELTKEKVKFLKEKESLLQENQILKKEVEKLKSIVDNS